MYDKFIQEFLPKVSKLEVNKEIDERNIHHIRYINELTNKYLKDAEVISAVGDILDEIVKEVSELSLDVIPSHRHPSLEVLLSNLTKKSDKKWKEKSIEICRINMTKLAKAVFDDDVFDVSKFQKEPQRVFDYLEGSEFKGTKNTAATYIRNLTAIFKCNKLENADLYLRIRNEKYPKNQWVEENKRPEGWDWNRVIREYEALKLKLKKTRPSKISRTKKKLHLLLAFYVELIPLRHQCFLELGYADNGQSNDYIDIDKKKMYIRNGKTIEFYGSTKYDLNDTLLEIIKDWKENYSLNEEYLLVVGRKNSKNYLQPILSSVMSAFFSKNFGVSSNVLRKLFVSDVVMKNPDKAYRNKIARMMLHSTGIQSLCYSQYE